MREDDFCKREDCFYKRENDFCFVKSKVNNSISDKKHIFAKKLMIVYPSSKINIGLSILCKRNDGYHDIESVFYPVNWNDILEITVDKNKLYNAIEFTATGIDIPGAMATNLIVKVYELISKDYALPALKVHLHKLIPIGAGLGGGSADAAYFIVALNSFDAVNLSYGEQHHYAKQIGADCGFFIINRPCVAKNIGDDLEPISLDLTGYFAAIIYPNITISTKEAYSLITPNATKNSIETLITLPIEAWKDTIINDFEAPVSKKYPVINAIKTMLYNKGAIYASLTGSGSAVYGIYKNEITFDTDFKYNYKIVAL